MNVWCIVLLFFVTFVRSVPTCNVKDYGAIGDNKTDDTPAIQRALNACKTGNIVFPAGAYLSKQIQVPPGAKDVTITLQRNSHLVLWRDIPTYPKVGFYSGFLYGKDVSNVTILGPGEIDGGGFRWWRYGKSISRPCLIMFNQSTGITVDGLTLRDGPFYHVLMIDSENVRVNNINVDSGCGYEHAPNTDGVHLWSVRNAYVGNSRVQNGDDCIPIRDASSNILVENMYCSCGQNAGVPVIWKQGGTLQNVIFRNITAVDTFHAAGIKSKKYTGVIRNVTFEDIKFHGVRGAAVYINVFNEDEPKPGDEVGLMHVYNVTYKNIHGTSTINPGKFLCGATRPCTGLYMEGLTISGVREAFKCENAYGEYKDATPPPCWKRK
eukprot:TRINITY_DN76306_c0_g1_i1.p1 TRINITY_DN76306_c0_g1~~TRINITY_DN76306_c0_g1_i1.p1  ORF type:complete len:380 (+),score=19.95 TRINITY_DN76306_c0_g1_i1:23-1162(+)